MCGWFGWPENNKVEAMRDAFARTFPPEELKKIAAGIQAEIYIPLGQ